MPALPAPFAATDTAADAVAIAAVARLAAGAGVPAYLVGGAVRDRLLGLPLPDLAPDLDIAIVGDAPGLARRLADTMRGRLTIHPRFGTATVVVPDGAGDGAGGGIGIAVDLVTARRETYPHPGALPVVQPGSIRDDLARRDFTINAMAIPITLDDVMPDTAAFRVVDYHNGRADLAAGVIRILHPESFGDDPTRILRAARYAARFDFRLADDTRHPLRQALADNALAAISGDRIRHELERIFNEPSPADALRRADCWGILSAIHPGLTARHLLTRNAAGPSDSQSPLTWLAMLTWPLPAPSARALAARLNAPAGWTRVLEDTARLADLLPGIAEPGRTPSAICALLDGISPHALTAGAALAPAAAARIIARYRHEWRTITPRLNGTDLLDLGIPPGPAVGEALRAIRRARLDGAAPTIADERRIARQWVAV